MKQKKNTSPIHDQTSLLSKDSDQTSQHEVPRSKTENRKIIIPKKTIRIAPTGDVYITALEQKIIDTTEFQRLRGIRQLGNVFHVFPTALHTRFDHSLGTVAITNRMIQAIKTNAHNRGDEKDISYEQEMIARLYALLHDICHIPFGHTIEDELCLVTRHDKNPRRILNFIGPDSTIGRLIRSIAGEEIYNRFMMVYLWEEGLTWKERMEKFAGEGLKNEWEPLKKWGELTNDDAFIYDLVSNTVCADLIDYITRDNFFCDLGCSVDFRFINFLYLRKMNETSKEDKRRVFIRLWKEKERIPRRDTLTDLTRLLEARYILAERVYFHHAKVISGVMIGRALQEMILAGQITEKDLFTITDDILLYRLITEGPPLTKKLVNAFLNRQLHRQFEHFIWDDFANIQSRDQSCNMEDIIKACYIDPQSRRELENQIASEIGAEPGDVLIYSPPRSMNLKVAHSKVIWSGQPTELQYIDDRLISPRLKEIITAHRELWRIYIICQRNLSENQLSLLRSSLEVYFKSSAKDKSDRESKYLKEIIANRLKNMTGLSQFAPDQYNKRLDEAAQYLMTQRTDKEKMKSFDRMLTQTITSFFSDN